MEFDFNVLALKRAMNEKHMSEAELARSMGVSRACINRIVRGQRRPSAKVITGLKIAFPDKSLDYFFSIDSPEPVE